MKLNNIQCIHICLFLTPRHLNSYHPKAFWFWNQVEDLSSVPLVFNKTQWIKRREGGGEKVLVLSCTRNNMRKRGGKKLAWNLLSLGRFRRSASVILSSQPASRQPVQRAKSKLPPPSPLSSGLLPAVSNYAVRDQREGDWDEGREKK